MKKEQLKLNNFALAMSLERYKACYEVELDAKKMWRKSARKHKRLVAELEETTNALHKRIRFLENRMGATEAPPPAVTFPED